MIVEVDGQAVRRPIPHIDYLAIVTITPNGFRVHEVNEQDAWTVWEGVSHFFHAKQGASFYDGVLNTPAAPTVSAENIVERIVALRKDARDYLARIWPQDLPTMKQQPTVSDLMRIDELVADVEAKSGATFAFISPPDECGRIDIDINAHIEGVFKTLPDDIQRCVEYVLHNTSPAIRQRKTLPTNRRYQILRMLIYAAQVAEGDIMRMNDLLPDNVGYITMADEERIADELSASLQTA
jgi:hypothetical protein